MGEQPWLAHYDAGVPRTLAPYPHKTLVDYVAETALQWPDHPALLFQGRCVTYEALTQLSDAFAEAMLACTCHPVRGQQKAGSVGLPLPDVEIDIVDLDRGARSLAPGEVGEVVLRAPQIMASYWQKPPATAVALRTRDAGEPWLYTGDIGYMDADGYLFLVDRKTDLMKTSGYQVWPREIEDVIATHPAVAEVGVAKMPDAVKGEGGPLNWPPSAHAVAGNGGPLNWPPSAHAVAGNGGPLNWPPSADAVAGEVAKAWVVLRPGASTTAGEIRAYCHEHLAPYKVPAIVVFRRALPKALLGGKVLRRLLDDAPADQPAVESDDARDIT